jgi:hypothetical protein
LWELSPFSLRLLHDGGLHNSAKQVHEIVDILSKSARTAQYETDQCEVFMNTAAPSNKNPSKDFKTLN